MVIDAELIPAALSLPKQGARIEIPMFEKIKLINHIAPHERSEN